MGDGQKDSGEYRTLVGIVDESAPSKYGDLKNASSRNYYLGVEEEATDVIPVNIIDTSSVTDVRIPQGQEISDPRVDPSRVLYQAPDAIKILTESAGSVPVSLREILEDNPDPLRLYDQFQQYMRDQEEGFLSNYDAETMHVVNDKGGCSILVQAYRKDVVAGAVDDSVNDLTMPKGIVIKLEYSSSKRSSQNVQLEKEIQRYSSVLTGCDGKTKSGVLPILGEEENHFSYVRPEHLDERIRNESRKLLQGHLPEGKLESTINSIVDYRIEVLPMPIAEGVTLKDYLKDKKQTVEELVDIFREIVQVVSKLHDGEVVHRDLKPSNIYVRDVKDENSKDRRVITILDFGISNYIGEYVDRQGTLEYVSPKQARENIVMPSHDIQALGIIFYEMIAGFNPRRSTGKKDSFVREMMAKITQTPPPIGDDKASTELRAVIMNAVHPEGTFNTCEEFLGVIEDAVKDSIEMQSINYRQLDKQERAGYKFGFPRVYKREDGMLMINDKVASAEMLGRVTSLTRLSLDRLLEMTPTEQSVKNFAQLEQQYLEKASKYAVAHDTYGEESVGFFVKRRMSSIPELKDKRLTPERHFTGEMSIVDLESRQAEEYAIKAKTGSVPLMPELFKGLTGSGDDAEEPKSFVNLKDWAKEVSGTDIGSSYQDATTERDEPPSDVQLAELSERVREAREFSLELESAVEEENPNLFEELSRHSGMGVKPKKTREDGDK